MCAPICDARARPCRRRRARRWRPRSARPRDASNSHVARLSTLYSRGQASAKETLNLQLVCGQSLLGTCAPSGWMQLALHPPRRGACRCTSAFLQPSCSRTPDRVPALAGGRPGGAEWRALTATAAEAALRNGSADLACLARRTQAQRVCLCAHGCIPWRAARENRPGVTRGAVPERCVSTGLHTLRLGRQAGPQASAARAAPARAGGRGPGPGGGRGARRPARPGRRGGARGGAVRAARAAGARRAGRAAAARAHYHHR